MKFRPSFRALPVGLLALIVSLYSIAVTALLFMNDSLVYRLLALSGVAIMTILAAAYALGVRLLVFASNKLVLTNISAVYTNMSIEFSAQGSRIILDRSGIETKVSSIGFLSLVGITKGKKGARDYLTSVIKKYINYRFIKESPNV